MRDFFKKFRIDRKRRNEIDRILEPHDDFLKETKAMFLLEIQKQKAQESYPWRKVVFAGVLAALLFNGTILVFADTKNVDANNPFYPYKRVAEYMRVRFAPTKEAKVDLQEQFAERRLEEIKKVEKNEKAEKTEIRKEKNREKLEELTDDLNQAIARTVDDATEVKKDKTERICEKLSKVVEEHKQIGRGKLKKEELVKDFCDEISAEQE